MAESTQPAPAQPAAGSTGLDPKLAILICWLSPFILGGLPIGSIVFLAIEKNDKRVRFHAWESLFYIIAVFVLSIGLGLLSMLITFVVPVIGCVTTPLFVVVGIAAFVVPIIATVKAYNGEDWKLPLVGEWATKQNAK